MSWSLATIQYEGAPTAFLKVGSEYHRIADLMGSLPNLGREVSLLALFQRWDEVEPVLTALADDIGRGLRPAYPITAPAAPEDFLTPIQFPSKVICIGNNYYDHVQKDGGLTAFKKEEQAPVFFLKPPSTTLVGAGRSVRAPTQSGQLDWEIELAFVIGRRARKVRPEAALNHIAGYTIAIDLSARDWQFNPKHLVKFDLFSGKAFDDSCPVGPWIVPARCVDPADLRLQLRVNGDLKQDASTRDMIWPLQEQIAAASEHLTLLPGDLFLTGTPAGVGFAAQTFLKEGDRLEATIEGLGTLKVEIGADSELSLREASAYAS